MTLRFRLRLCWTHVWETVRYPLLTSVITWDAERETIDVQRWHGRRN